MRRSLALPLLGAVALGAALLVQRPASAASAQDGDFIQSAMRREIGAYALATLAQRKATGPVRAFAAKLGDDAGAAVNALRSLAKEAGVSAPEVPALNESAQYDALGATSGGAFDRSLAHDVMIDANIALDTFSDEAAHGNDPRLRKFAAAQIPTLRAEVRGSESLPGGSS